LKEDLSKQQVFCFTSDMEWTPDWAIAEMLALFDRYEVPLTPFVTHESQVIKDRYTPEDMQQRVGLHPNFLPGSSHGNTTDEVIDSVRRFWPAARGFRSHSFFDHTHITAAFVQRGFKYDSNLCLFLEPECRPLRHASGLLRFPVFWEDDIHFGKQLPFELATIRSHLDRPGMKVFNVHPLLVALNVPTADYYQSSTPLYRSFDPETWRKSVFNGAGVHTFLEELLQYVKTHDVRLAYLDHLFCEVTGESETAPKE
jgi:Polysaccharide deacetylase